MVAFQSAFRVEIYQNDVFFILKKLFLKSAHQNDSKHTKKIILVKKMNFLGTRFTTRFQTAKQLHWGICIVF